MVAAQKGLELYDGVLRYQVGLTLMLPPPPSHTFTVARLHPHPRWLSRKGKPANSSGMLLLCCDVLHCFVASVRVDGTRLRHGAAPALHQPVAERERPGAPAERACESGMTRGARSKGRAVRRSVEPCAHIIVMHHGLARSSNLGLAMHRVRCAVRRPTHWRCAVVCCATLQGHIDEQGRDLNLHAPGYTASRCGGG